MRVRPGRWVVAFVLIAAASVAAACGKKGPPLPPFVHVPDGVRELSVRRLGADAFLTMTAPTQNVDQSTPVSFGRIDVWGYTGRSAPPVSRFVSVATLLGTVPAGPTAQPGVVVTFRDELTGDKLTEAKTPEPVRAAVSTPVREATGPLKRYYLVIPFSDRGRPGPPSTIVELPITPLPDVPLDVEASYNEQRVSVRWSPSGGLVGFLLDRAPLPPASPLDDGPPVNGAGTLPAGPTRYNVYRDISQGETSQPSTTDGSRAVAPMPITSMPVDGFTFDDSLQLDGSRRCYRVSAVRGAGDRAVESEPSKEACIVAVDTFPPVAPTGLSPIAVEDAISLIWEANREPDIGGYIVLRGEGDGPLVPLTDQPVTETRYTDSSVRAGVRYVYAVKAVDSWKPQPNISPESAHVDVTAR